MKKLLMLVMVAVVMLATSIQAANIFEGGAGAGDPSWFTVANWDVGVPGAADDVWLDTSVGYGPVVDAAGAVGNIMTVGIYGHDGDLTISAAGELSLSGITLVGDTIVDKGSVLNNGIYNTGTIYMRGESTLVNNGTLTTPGNIQLGDMAGSTSLFTNTGVVNVGTWFIVSVDSTEPAIFNMNGGLMVNAHMVQNNSGNGHSIINLNAGIISNSTAALDGTANSLIVVDNGKMYIAGDQTATIDFLISSGFVTGKDSKTAYSSFDGTNTELGAIPEPATLGLLAVFGLAFLRRK